MKFAMHRKPKEYENSEEILFIINEAQMIHIAWNGCPFIIWKFSIRESGVN